MNTQSLRRIFQILLILSAISNITTVTADVFSVTASTSKKNIGTQSTSVTVFWRMNADLTCPDTNPIRVFSTSGTLGYTHPITGALIVQTVNKTLSKSSITVPANSPAIVTFTEGLLIPQSLIQRAIKDGAFQIAYVRSFGTTNGCPGSGGLVFNITGSSAAGFSVGRQSMRFDDNSIVKLLNEKEVLKAKADVNYNGSGQLQAFWEVAGPSTAGGVPIFRTMRSVRKYLLSGGTKATFVSPILPTTIAGAYMVRMRVTSPLPGFESPVIRYFVGARGASVAPPQPMRLGNPADRAWLGKDTRFNWQGIKGARHYRLEFYAKVAETDIASALPNLGDKQTSKKPVRLKGGPVTGIMLPGDALQTGLTSTVRRHLIAGRWYYWRVIAIGKDGKIVGLSPIREVRIP